MQKYKFILNFKRAFELKIKQITFFYIYNIIKHVILLPILGKTIECQCIICKIKEG